jgi:protocatechuate 3,4-dioxygenase beta subunit
MTWVLTMLLALPASAYDLEGFVYAPDGTPVDGAIITAHALASPATAVATTKSDKGRFVFTKLPELVLDIKARAEGLPEAQMRVSPYDAQVQLLLAPRSDAETTRPTMTHDPRAPKRTTPGNGTISGIVRVGDKPLAGAPVTVQGIADDFVEPVQVVTDAKGRYEARGLHPIRYMVTSGEGLWPRLRPHGYGRMHDEGGSGPQSADLTNARSATVDIPLTLAPLITGRVTDAEGAAVAGAFVQVVLSGRSSLDFTQSEFARTTADGRYTLSAPPFEAMEMAEIAVRLRTSSTVRSKPFQVGREDKRIDVVLPKFNDVTLRIVDAAGKAVPKARVVFLPSEESPALRELDMLFMPMFATRALRANEAGELALQLAPASYDFAATAEGFQVRTLQGRSIAKPTSIDLALEQAFKIRGRVHRKGVGVANAHIALDNRERARRPGRPLATQGDGTFEIDGLARGKYTLQVTKFDELIDRTVEAQAPGTIDIELPPAGTLRLRVLDAVTREAVQQFMYSIEPLDERSEPRRGRSLSRGDMQTNGMLTATLSTGRYRISVNAQGYTESRPQEVVLTEREPADVEILLDRGITITGRVTDEAGSPLAEASVFVVNAEMNEMAARSSTRVAPGNANTGADGTFTISGLQPGPISVTARREGFVAYRRTHDAESLAPLEIRLERGLTLSGIVQRNGKPLAEVEIGATTAASGGDHQSTRSDAQGRFQLHGLIAARYTLHAYRDEISKEVRDVDPSQKREVVINLDPEPRGVIHGTVTGLPRNLGGKITRRAVFVQGDQRGADAPIDETGNYRVEDAPTGTVWVIAQLESPSTSRSSVRKRVEVAPGQQVRVDLDLSPALTVRGRVSLEGRPLASARVVFLSDENAVGASASTNQDGSYELALPAPGIYRVMAHAERVDMRNYESVREIRGSETIDIDIREQTVEGIVVDAETRTPIAGAIVTLAPEAKIESYAGETITDAHGRFRIVTAAHGPHRAIVSATGYAHRSQALALGGTTNPQLSFELSRTDDLRVRVIDAKTGTPLEAHVVLETLEGLMLPVRLQRTPDGGLFTFSVAPGKYRLTTVVHGYTTKKVEVTAPGLVTVSLD